MSKSPEQEFTEQQLDTYSALASVAATEGGQILRKSLAGDIIGAIDELSSHAGALAETYMRTQNAKIGVWLSMYRALSNAEANAHDAQVELDALLKP